MRYYAIEREEIDFFREDYEFLSNFYPTYMIFEGREYFNAESAYQAQKCADKSGQDLFSSLRGNEAKRLGSEVTYREDWDEIKVSIMEAVVRTKFEQNAILMRRLIETGNKPLKEGNTWGDLFWGVDLDTGEGENHLGRILMDLRHEYQEKGLQSIENNVIRKKFGLSDNITVEFGDIIQSDCECIVTTTNKKLYEDRGINRAIHQTAGCKLLEECKKLGKCKKGEAKITKGYLLKAAHVIHTVGPHYGEKNDEEILKACYYNCMELAMKNDIHSIAFPSISTGRFSYPRKACAKIAVETILKWKEEHPNYIIEVEICCMDFKIYRCFCESIYQHLLTS